MIKIYGMPSCPDCSFVERQAEGREGYEVIDIGSHVRLLKEFLRLRDRAGIPCFVLDDGRVTLVPEEAGLKSRDAAPDSFAVLPNLQSGSAVSADLQSADMPYYQSGSSCSLDGKGC